MKPKIIILMHYMELGGAEMALLGLLEALDPKRVNVDLFIYSHRGPLMKSIPDYINLLPEIESYSLIEKPVVEALGKGHMETVIARILAKFRHKLYRMMRPTTLDDISIVQYVGNCVTPCLPKINPEVEYDLCISFLTPHNIGCSKVKAKKRLAWIHTDYSTVGLNTKMELSVWQRYDYIASISDSVTSSFVKVFPSLKSKIIEIENIIPEEYVKSCAATSIPAELKSGRW